MKKLTRDEMKKVSGGRPPKGGFCNHPSECGSGNNWDCVTGYTAYQCINNQCVVARCS